MSFRVIQGAPVGGLIPLSPVSRQGHRDLCLETRKPTAHCITGRTFPRMGNDPLLVTQQVNKRSESNLQHKVGHEHFQLDAGSNPLPHSCSIPILCCLPSPHPPSGLLVFVFLAN